MALSKVDVANMLTGVTPVANGGTALSSGFLNGITMADQWRVTADFSNSSGMSVISSNWEENDTSFTRIGSVMTQSSGIFTFPSTGIYYINFNSYSTYAAEANYVGIHIDGTEDNSSYSPLADAYTHFVSAADGNELAGINCNAMFDVTNTTNCKVRFQAESSANATFNGNTSKNRTYATFLRLGDT
jgi:hypothetical protein